MASKGDDDLVRSLDSGMNKCGNIFGIICAVICVIVIICLFGFGIFGLVNAKKIEKNTTKVTSKITKINNQNNVCELETITTTNNNRTTTQQIYHCNLEVEYTYNNEKYSSNLLTNDIGYTVGTNIDILVDKTNPSKIYYAKEIINEDTGSKILFVIGTVLIMFTIIHIVLLSKSTFYKKIVCAQQSISLLRSFT